MPSQYQSIYESWKSDPHNFWQRAAARIDWFKKPRQVFDSDTGGWFVGGEANTCYNAVDRHVEAGRGSQVALIYDSPVTGTKRKITYAELLDEVETLAAALADLGVGKGDRIIIYMPMVPESVVAMLASARLGAIHSVVFGALRRRSWLSASMTRNRKRLFRRRAALNLRG